MVGQIVIICKGGCGKTTDDVSFTEFWEGKIEQVDESMVPLWTCKECSESTSSSRSLT